MPLMHFHRPALAKELARHLLSPTLLQSINGRSSLFLTGPGRTGKTAFLASDLVPELETQGAAGVYVDLERFPDGEYHFGTSRIRPSAAAFVAQVATLLGSRTAQCDGELIEAASALVRSAGSDVVLIVDGFDGALTRRGGSAILRVLRDAADAVRDGPAAPCRLLLLVCGKHAAGLRSQLADSAHPITGAQVLDLPALGTDFVEFVLQQLSPSTGPVRLSLSAGVEAFARLAHRPGELLRALSLVRLVPGSEQADTALLATANALRSGLAERELARLFGMGALPLAIFGRMAGGEPAPFSEAAKSAYEQATGRRYSTSEIQSALNALVVAGYVTRSGRGTYVCADPLVQQLWHERQRLQTWSTK